MVNLFLDDFLRPLAAVSEKQLLVPALSISVSDGLPDLQLVFAGHVVAEILVLFNVRLGFSG
jgi:hypothetical protein